jgi:DNA-binding winged helix-turn-helix (wHTH) protein
MRRSQLWITRSRPKGGCRALDIHIVLAERAGEVAGKAELIARVLPSANVDDPIEAVARCSP